MSRRSAAVSIALAFALVLLQTVAAYAEYRGTDLWGNITPVSNVGGLIDRYPISNYQLDYHVSVGVTHMDDVFAATLQALGSVVFLALAWLVRMIIMAFGWAVSIDVVNGPHGLLAPVGAAGQHFYFSVIKPLLEVALVILGVWGGWKLKNREGSDTFSVLARAFCMTIVAMAIVFQPAATIGRANDMATQFASQIASTGGDVSNEIFETFVYRPWVLLQFGSLDKVCTSSKTDQDGFPFAASYGHPDAKVCHSVQHQDADGHGGYVERFLAYPHGSSKRDGAYDALDHGTQTSDASGKIDRTDAPAVDMMQAGGTVQRMVGLLIMAFGIACAVLLLGRIALALIFAQVVLLILLGMAPVVVIASILPWTQGVFSVWGKLILQLLIGKSMFIAMLVLIVTVSSALTSVQSTWGYLFVFILQSAAFAGALYLHKHISKAAFGAAHKAHEHSHHAATAFVGGSAMTAVAVAAAPKDFIQRIRHSGDDSVEQVDEKQNVREHAPEPKTDVVVGAPRPDSSSPPASAGREYSPPGAPASQQVQSPAPTSNPSAPPASMREQETEMPTTSFKDDLERARSEHQWPRESPEVSSEPAPVSTEPRFVSSRTFADYLEEAQLAKERPLPPDELERVRRR